MSVSLRRQLAYDQWANDTVLTALQELGAATPPPAQRCMGHVVGTQHVWVARILGRRCDVPIWPEGERIECRARLMELRALWSEVLAAFPAVRLVRYVSSKGERFENSVEDIVLHVTHHGAYHRGQIASSLRAAGHAPPATDFILFARAAERAP